MRLPGPKVLLLSIALVVSCRDSTGPTTVSARFELTDIDGRALPTPPAFTPGLTPTILSSTVTLDRGGNAAITVHETAWDGSDVTTTSNYTYQITDSRIVLTCSPPYDPAGLCGFLKGTFFFGRLSLEMGHVNSDPITYNYRIATN